MSAALQHSPVPTARAAVLELTSEMSLRARNRLAFADLSEGLRMWRLSWILGWLDIRLRYRGSLLGPFWLTLSTSVMVASLGFLYSTLFQMNLTEYLPFLALSLVLWNFTQTLVSDACGCFTQYRGHHPLHPDALFSLCDQNRGAERPGAGAQHRGDRGRVRDLRCLAGLDGDAGGSGDRALARRLRRGIVAARRILRPVSRHPAHCR